MSPDHRVVVERQLWIERHRPYRTCPRGSAPGVGWPGGHQLGGCSVCWSPRYWRLVCSCGWTGGWVDGASEDEQAQARRAYAGHHPGADLGGWALLGAA